MTTHTRKTPSQATAPEAPATPAAATAAPAGAPAASATADSPATTQRQPLDRQAIVGIKRNLGGIASITLVGKDYTPGALVAVFENRVQAADATDESQRAWHDNVTVERKLEGNIVPIRKALRSFLVAKYGEMSKKLEEFGVTPAKKKRKPDTATLAAAVKKSEATRVARGTMGKRQKAKVKGVPANAKASEEPGGATPSAAPAASAAPVAANGTAAVNGTAGK